MIDFSPPVGGALEQRVEDPHEHGFFVAEYFRIPEAQYGEAASLQVAIAPFVARIGRMLPAVDFDDEFAFEADEIHHVVAERMLAPEPGAVELAQAQMTPEPAFGIGGVAAQPARDLGAADEGVGLAVHGMSPRRGTTRMWRWRAAGIGVLRVVGSADSEMGAVLGRKTITTDISPEGRDLRIRAKTHPHPCPPLEGEGLFRPA